MGKGLGGVPAGQRSVVLVEDGSETTTGQKLILKILKGLTWGGERNWHLRTEVTFQYKISGSVNSADNVKLSTFTPGSTDFAIILAGLIPTR